MELAFSKMSVEDDDFFLFFLIWELEFGFWNFLGTIVIGYAGQLTIWQHLNWPLLLSSKDSNLNWIRLS